MTRWTARMRVTVALGAGWLGLGAASNAACASKPRSAEVDLFAPDYGTYREHVDAYLQRRCGTLDCHGQAGRAYRIYGFSGLRDAEDDAGLVSGKQPTTEAEVRANYASAVGLEPEEMSRLMASDGAQPTRLMLLRKPLRLERHKGGPAMAEDDVGYRCIVAWLRIRTVQPTPDGEDFEPIPEKERDKFSQRARLDCEEAKNQP